MPKKNTKPSQNQKSKESLPSSQPWIKMRSGLIIIAIVSIGVTVLTALQAIPAKGPIEGILWSLIFGASIWIIFFGAYLINRFIRRG